MTNTIKSLLHISIFCSMLFCVMQANGNQLPEKISIASDQWCPYVCDVKSDKPGYLIEVSNVVFAKLGIEPLYHALGWQKSIDLTLIRSN